MDPTQSQPSDHFLAIDNVCAWPNLQRLANGDIVALLFNQPTHGRWEGEVECWGSTDDGQTWALRGVPVPHAPQTNRMNHSAGIARDGALVAIVSGWSNRPKRGVLAASFDESLVLEPIVSRSTDGGRTWRQGGSVAALPEYHNPVPYGNIHACGDGVLMAPFYGPKRDKGGKPLGRCASFVFRSTDDGLTWGDPSLIADDHTETFVLPVNDTRWLAAARSDEAGNEQRLDLYVSEDAGRTWKFHQHLTGAWQHPAHMLRLANGHIALTHGIRMYGIWGSIGARISEDEGRTWKKPAVLKLAPTDNNDGGYPSSVQLPDGRIVTAYYGARTATHHRYHMSVIRWRVEDVMKMSWLP